MRVLHLLNDVTDRGNGIVHAAIDLAAGQVACGDTVAIVSSGGGLEPLLRRLGIQHVHLIYGKSPLTLTKALMQLKRLINIFKPDIIHAHVRTGVVLGWAISKITGVPLVAHLHNIHEKESLMMALADRVIAVSSSVADTIAKQGISKHKIRVVLNGPLESPRSLSLPELEPADLQRPAIVTVCGMNHRKGIADLLVAFDQVASDISNVHLYLVGDGPDINVFRESANRLASKSRIHFEGCQTIPQRYMAAADVFVLASRRESFGLVLLEAREIGCAIVASDVDGIPEALDSGAAGVLFRPGDVSELAENLIRLIRSPEERLSLKRKSRLGLDKFTYINMARNVSVVYRELLGQYRLDSASQASAHALNN